MTKCQLICPKWLVPSWLVLEGIINPDCVVLFHSVWKLGQNLIQRLASYLKLTHLFITPILATLHWLPVRHRISVFEPIFEYEAQIHFDSHWCTKLLSWKHRYHKVLHSMSWQHYVTSTTACSKIVYWSFRTCSTVVPGSTSTGFPSTNTSTMLLAARTGVRTWSACT